MASNQRGLFERTGDGCHRYGWLLTIVINGLLLAYFAGAQAQALTDIRERVMRLEQQIDRYARQIAGDK